MRKALGIEGDGKVWIKTSKIRRRVEVENFTGHVSHCIEHVMLIVALCVSFVGAKSPNYDSRSENRRVGS